MKKIIIIALILALSVGLLVWSLLSAPEGEDDTTSPSGPTTSATTTGAGSTIGSGSTTGSSTSASTSGTTASTTAPSGGLGDEIELPDDSL